MKLLNDGVTGHVASIQYDYNSIGVKPTVHRDNMIDNINSFSTSTALSVLTLYQYVSAAI